MYFKTLKITNFSFNPNSTLIFFPLKLNFHSSYKSTSMLTFHLSIAQLFIVFDPRFIIFETPSSCITKIEINGTSRSNSLMVFIFVLSTTQDEVHSSSSTQDPSFFSFSFWAFQGFLATLKELIQELTLTKRSKLVPFRANFFLSDFVLNASLHVLFVTLQGIHRRRAPMSTIQGRRPWELDRRFKVAKPHHLDPRSWKPWTTSFEVVIHDSSTFSCEASRSQVSLVKISLFLAPSTLLV